VLERRATMNIENIKTIVIAIIKSVISNKAKAEKVISSIEEKPNGVIVVYLSHGATLGDAIDIQEQIRNAGLAIPAQLGNAAIYVTEK
jgi:hypothetical protein